MLTTPPRAYLQVDAPKPEDSFGNVASECGPAAEFMAKLPPKLGDIAARGAVTAGALASLALAPGSMVVRQIRQDLIHERLCRFLPQQPW